LLGSAFFERVAVSGWFIEIRLSVVDERIPQLRRGFIGLHIRISGYPDIPIVDVQGLVRRQAANEIVFQAKNRFSISA
jgi:hypothetical protein